MSLRAVKQIIQLPGDRLASDFHLKVEGTFRRFGKDMLPGRDLNSRASLLNDALEE
jgi:hypothetical protein